MPAIPESKKDALKLTDRPKFYYGTKCKYGHGDAQGRNLRYTTSSRCRECANEMYAHYKQRKASQG